MDIIGKEIVCFEFKSDNVLNYGDGHKKRLNTIGKVIDIHSSQPAYSRVGFEDGGYQYYPTSDIVKHLEHLNRPIEDVIKDLSKDLYKILRKI